MQCQIIKFLFYIFLQIIFYARLNGLPEQHHLPTVQMKNPWSPMVLVKLKKLKHEQTLLRSIGSINNENEEKVSIPNPKHPPVQEYAPAKSKSKSEASAVQIPPKACLRKYEFVDSGRLTGTINAAKFMLRNMDKRFVLCLRLNGFRKCPKPYRIVQHEGFYVVNGRANQVAAEENVAELPIDIVFWSKNDEKAQAKNYAEVDPDWLRIWHAINRMSFVYERKDDCWPQPKWEPTEQIEFALFELSLFESSGDGSNEVIVVRSELPSAVLKVFSARRSFTSKDEESGGDNHWDWKQELKFGATIMQSLELPRVLVQGRLGSGVVRELLAKKVPYKICFSLESINNGGQNEVCPRETEIDRRWWLLGHYHFSIPFLSGQNNNDNKNSGKSTQRKVPSQNPGNGGRLEQRIWGALNALARNELKSQLIAAYGREKPTTKKKIVENFFEITDIWAMLCATQSSESEAKALEDARRLQLVVHDDASTDTVSQKSPIKALPLKKPVLRVPVMEFFAQKEVKLKLDYDSGTTTQHNQPKKILELEFGDKVQRRDGTVIVNGGDKKA